MSSNPGPSSWCETWLWSSPSGLRIITASGVVSLCETSKRSNSGKATSAISSLSSNAAAFAASSRVFGEPAAANHSLPSRASPAGFSGGADLGTARSACRSCPRRRAAAGASCPRALAEPLPGDALASDDPGPRSAVAADRSGFGGGSGRTGLLGFGGAHAPGVLTTLQKDLDRTAGCNCAGSFPCRSAYKSCPSPAALPVLVDLPASTPPLPTSPAPVPVPAAIAGGGPGGAPNQP
mmetsp:Transcript_81545/g.149441  ORF Transcript_81545/g.149441 Transcript_81545/m.149441 type:complete len:237 (+) Transcript_81545:100-810(+)